MKAITATGKIDQSGQLSLDSPLKNTPPKSVRVIILFEGIDEEENRFGEEIIEYQHRPLMSAEKLQHELKQSLIESGYDSREKIIQLVQDIKQEMYQEHP